MQETSVTCVYGSVTGKSQSIAEQLVSDAVGRGHNVQLFSFESFGKSWNLQEVGTLIIISSTTGDGEQPEAVTKFWRKLRPKSLPANHLNHVQYTILGLGDTNYNQFCNAPKNLKRRLGELGAQEFYPCGWADDGTGLEIVVEPWLEGLWISLKDLKDRHGIRNVNTESQVASESGSNLSPLAKPDCSSCPETTLRYSSALSGVPLDVPACPPRYLEVEYLQENLCEDNYQNNMKLPLSAGGPQTCRVVSNRSLSSKDAVKTYMEMFLQSDAMFEFKPGDSFGVICENSGEDVKFLCNHLQLDIKDVCHVYVMKETKKARAKVPEFLPPKGSIETLLKTCLNLRTVPKKLFIRSLVEYTTDPREKRRLEELCSKQGSSEYMSLILGDQVTLIDLLKEFTSCQPPLALLLEHLGRLLPRPYSVSSSPLTSSQELGFIYTVVESPRPGLATTWLRSLSDGNEVTIYPRVSSDFHPPTDTSANYIMICAGSGIGPFLGFLEHRRQLAIKGGKVMLFFGCRNKTKDFLHQEKLEQFVEEGHLSRLIVSCSRDEDNQGVKYVQHSLEKFSKDVSGLILEDDADIFVCGDAKNMGRDVNEALIKILSNENVNGADFLKKMSLDRKYKQDLWT